MRPEEAHVLVSEADPNNEPVIVDFLRSARVKQIIVSSSGWTNCYRDLLKPEQNGLNRQSNAAQRGSCRWAVAGQTTQQNTLGRQI